MSVRRRFSGPALLLLLGAAAASTARAQEFECPRLIPVRETEPAATAFNVLFLPDAFVVRDGKNELPAFRCAVDLLVQGLLTSQPFRNFGCHLNFYRMDTHSSYDDVLQYYSSTSCTADDAAWPRGTEDCPEEREPPSGEEQIELDPRSRVCPATQNGVAYPVLILPDATGQQAVLDVAANCAPDGASFQLVVVVVDTEHEAGGAFPSTSPPISVVTLDDISSSGRFFKLAHEVAHALTLLDEYTEGFDPDTAGVQYEGGINLWHACDDNDGNGAPDGPAGIPWSSGCDAPSGQQPRVKSCSNEYVDSPCRVVCANGYGDDYCGVSEPIPWPVAGLYEGGFYSRRDYFRSAYECAMNQIGKPFCLACRCGAKRFLESMGLSECPSRTSLCADQPDHEILARDCEDDYGGTPSMCDNWDLSPDLELVRDGNDDAIVRACATNIGPEPIPGEQTVTLRFMVSERLPTVRDIGSGNRDLPTIHQSTRKIKYLTGEVSVPAVWQIGERRCLDAKINLGRSFRDIAVARPESRGIAVMSLASSASMPVDHVKDDSRLVQKLVTAMVAELD